MLKISGEALAGSKGLGLDAEIVKRLAAEIAGVHKAGVSLGLVIGGGNIFRGITSPELGISRTTGDMVGMCATIINSLVFRDALMAAGTPAVVMNAVSFDKACELFTADAARAHCDAGRVVIAAGGTGNPFFSTDTAAALRALEIGAQVLLKGTKVDGIYNDDPVKNLAAVKLTRLTHQEALEKRLKFMDATALSLCQDSNLPIALFKLLDPEALMQCVCGQPVGSLVKTGG